MRKYPINRSDKVYLEIENFEDYELTNCIAYEMAIRNDEVNKLKDTYFIELRKCLNPNRKDFNSEVTNICSTKLSEFGISPFDINFGGKHFAIINTYTNNKNNGKQLIEADKDIIADINFTETLDKNIVGEIDIECKLELSRPILSLSTMTLIKPILNLSLPKNELIAYISKIKDEYDKDTSIIKNPIEFLGENLEKADNEISITRPKGRQEHINIRKHINKQEKYADMFFIYDAYKKSMKQKDIIQSINDYYYDTKNKETYFDAKTVTKYREIAKEYIDNLKYKELITGIKEK